MDPAAKNLLSKNVAVYVSWQWREPERTLESVQQECTEFLQPFAATSLQYFVTSAANVDDYSSDGFHAMLTKLETAPVECVVFLHTDDLFLLSENKIDFFTWIRVIQSYGCELYFIRQDACTASSVKDFLPKIQY
jgi:hypothetical protein